MNREKQIRYCLTCKERTMSPEKGVLCGLTDDIAKFEHKCNSYRSDLKTIEKIIDDKVNFYELNKNPAIIGEVIFLDNGHKTTSADPKISSYDLNKELPVNMKFVKSKKLFVLELIIMIFVLALIAILSFLEFHIIIAFIIILWGGYGLWRFINNFSKKVSEIEIDLSGITLDNNQLSWETVLGTLVRLKTTGKRCYQEMILLTASNDIDFEISGYNENANQIKYCIELYRMKFLAKN